MAAHEEIFENQLPDSLAVELETANALQVKPVSPGDVGFDEAVNQGTIKWAVTLNNQLRVIPHTIDGIELAHTVLTEGSSVRSAGQAEVVGYGGAYVGLFINNHSGHYQPSAASLDLGIQKFAEADIDFAEDGIQRI